MTKKFTGSFGVFSAGAAITLVLGFGVTATPASAAGLSEVQVQAIVSLLQSFGADASVTGNVTAALHGEHGSMMNDNHGMSGGDSTHGQQGMMGSSSMGAMGDSHGRSDGQNDHDIGGSMRGQQGMMGSSTMGGAFGNQRGRFMNHGRPDWRLMNQASSSASSTTPCASITAALSVGSTDSKTGGQVKMLQEFLRDHLNLQDNIVTGFFGPKTAQHLKEFQAEEGLDQVGRVGGQTRAALARSCGGLGHMMPRENHHDSDKDHTNATTTTTVNASSTSVVH